MVIDEFHTIKSAGASELKVKGSKFIGIASPVDSEISAERFIHTISKKYFNATHHCYAYQIGYGKHIIFRCHDDGEPSGTAGKPVHRAIVNKQLTDVVVVVTRYFGGTKLGTGGLARAYGNSAADVLNRCEIVTTVIGEKIRIQFPYEETEAVMHVIRTLGGNVIESRYDQAAHLLVQMRLREIDRFRIRLKDATRGKVLIFPKE